MSEAIALPWFISLFALAVIWLILIVWTFHRLRIRHVATYEAIGSPSLFWNNSMRNNWLFAKFLFRGQWQSLNDSTLAAVARLMQVLIVVYFVGLVGWVVVFMLVGIVPA